MKADEHLRAGDLDAARAELVATVKRAPSDQGARMFLWQLLCVVGEWDKAQAQLRALAQLSPEAQMLATAYGGAIEAERAREAAFAGGGEFAVLAGSGGWIDALAAALGAFAGGDASEGERLREEAFDAAPDSPGEADGRRFAWIADADARFGPALEAVVNGRWGLLPFEALEAVAFEGASDLRDIVWAPAQLKLKTGLSVAALLPARYPGSQAGSAPVRLARATEWASGPAGEEGRGQRLLSFDAGEDAGLLSLRSLRFD